jgi:hypothetical protein
MAVESELRSFYFGGGVIEKCLLSIDWDYFIHTRKDNWGSYTENTKNIINLWYKRYIQAKEWGNDIQKLFQLSPGVDGFWDKIREHFKIPKKIKAPGF